jgi:hypothetical protein
MASYPRSDTVELFQDLYALDRIADEAESSKESTVSLDLRQSDTRSSPGKDS